MVDSTAWGCQLPGTSLVDLLGTCRTHGPWAGMQLPEACTDLSTTLQVVLQGGLARMTMGTSAGLAWKLKKGSKQRRTSKPTFTKCRALTSISTLNLLFIIPILQMRECDLFLVMWQLSGRISAQI